MISFSPRAAPAQAPVAPAPAGPLTLSQAQAEAFAANPTARTAIEQSAQAQARLAQAGAQGRLQLSFTTSGGAANVDVAQPPPAHQTFRTLQNTITLAVPLGARPRLVIRGARYQLAAVQAQQAGARLALAAQVTVAYYDLLRKQALRTLSQETLDQAARQQGEAEKRFRAGDVPELDVLRAQTPVAAAQASLVAAETAAEIARQALNGLLGRPLADPLAISEVPTAATAAVGSVSPDTTPTLAPLPSEGDALARALASSPDIKAAEATVRASAAALAASRRFRDPALSLQAVDTRSGDQTGFRRENAVQASLTIPLSDGGLGRAQIREAEAVQAQATAQAAGIRRQVEITLGAVYVTAVGSRRQRIAAAAARAIAQTTAEKTERGYTGGLFPLTDVLNAQAAYRQARIAYTQALYDAALAEANLAAAMDGAALGAASLTGAGPGPGGMP